MNTANLQLEGLLLAIASINNLLVRKGVMTVAELEIVLARADATAVGDERFAEDLTPANRDAIRFPIRFLRAANNSASETEISTFSELTRFVGETKNRDNDEQ
jgi:hypothetical protein